MATYTFIVPVHDSPVLTEHFLERIRVHLDDGDASLVLVSDGDDSLHNKKLLKSAAQVLPRTEVIFVNDWLGYGSAANRAVSQTNAEYLVFLNADTFPMPESPQALVSTLAHNKAIGVAQGLLLHPQNFLVQSAGHIFGHYFNRHALLGRRADDRIVNTQSRRQALTSAFYVTPRSLFLSHGGFDEWYWNSHEGMEYSLKVHLSGLECIYYPKAKAYHIHGGTRRGLQISERQQLARFWTLWGTRVSVDIVELLSAQLPTTNCTRYLRIDLGTDRSWSAVLDKLPLQAEQIARYHSESSTIVLQNVISPSVGRAKGALLYLTDHFSQISANKLWFGERRGQGDVVLDCHGNVLLTDSLL